MGCILSPVSPADQPPSTDTPNPTCIPTCTKKVRPEKPCRITGCTFMKNGYLVTVDTSNKRVKIFDTDLRCRSFLILESRPFDVASIGSNLYVTLPKKKLVQKLTVTFPCICVKRKLINRSTFPTEGQCLGIVARPAELIVSMKFDSHANKELTDSAWQIQIMTTAGVVKRRIMHSPEGNALFYGAKYLALSPNKKELVISEAADNRIICLNLETGELNFNIHMDDPKGVICDSNNNIYILGKHGTIRWILANRQSVKVLLDGTRSINYADTITYSHARHSLAIPRNENKIELYKIRASRIEDHKNENL